MNLPKRLTRHQAEPLCELFCEFECCGDCDCNPVVQQAWTKLRERLLVDVPDDTALLRQALNALDNLIDEYQYHHEYDEHTDAAFNIVTALRERMGENDD